MVSEANIDTVTVSEGANSKLNWVDQSYWHFVVTKSDYTLKAFAEDISTIATHHDYKSPLIIDRQNSFAFAPGVLQTARRITPQFLSAIAFVAYTPISFRLSLFESNEFLTDLPTSVFDDMDHAIQWLREEHFGGLMVPIDKRSIWDCED